MPWRRIYKVLIPSKHFPFKRTLTEFKAEVALLLNFPPHQNWPILHQILLYFSHYKTWGLPILNRVFEILKTHSKKYQCKNLKKSQDFSFPKQSHRKLLNNKTFIINKANYIFDLSWEYLRQRVKLGRSSSQAWAAWSSRIVWEEFMTSSWRCKKLLPSLETDQSNHSKTLFLLTSLLTT